MSASHPSAIANNRESTSDRDRPVSRSKDSGNGLATGLSNANRNRESQDTSNSGSDHVGITHSQDERRTIKRKSSTGVNATEGPNAAEAGSGSDSRQTGHKRRKALASCAALVVSLASLGLRIAELVEGMN